MISDRTLEMWRRPDCTAQCQLVHAIDPGMLRRILVESHDLDGHQEHWRRTAGPGAESAGIVRTGPLVVDRWQKTATLGGQQLRLTDREWEILEYLAARIGRLCGVRELAVALGAPDADGEHHARVVISRLRCKLGAYAALLENRKGRGYRLVQLPTPAQGVELLPPAPRAWARDWERCACCGRTDRAHAGHGRCEACRNGARRSLHVGPCAAPREAEGCPSL